MRRPFRAPSASIASARQQLLPRPASPAELPRLPLPPARSGFRRRAAPPQDSAPAARTARAPVAGISAVPPRCSRLLVSAGQLPRLLSSPAPSGSRRRAAPPQDPAPAARTARAPVAETSAAPLRCSRLPVSAGTLPRLLSSPVPFGSRPHAAPPQDPAPAARTARAPVAGISAVPLRCSRLPVSAGPLPRLLSPPVPSGSRPRAAPPQDPAPAARTARAPVAETSAAPLRCSPLACFSRDASSLAFVASAVWVSTSRRAAARSCSSRADRSRSCCRDFCSSASPLPLACFSRDASSLAFAASAVWVSTSRRAAARSCSSRADRSRSCCRDFCSSASLLPLACFSRDASSLAFVASAVWVSTSRRAAARSCSSRADRSRSCCRDFCSSAAPLSACLFQPGRFLACFRRQCRLGLDITPRRRKILLQPRGPLALLLQRLLQLRFAALRLPVSAGTLPRLLFASAVWVSTSRRAAARSCSSRADRSRSCCRDFCSSASLLPLACFSRDASSLAFASAVWVSTSRRAAARSCSSRADRSRSCCREFCSLRRRHSPSPVSAGTLARRFLRQRGLGFDVAPRRRKSLLQLLGPIVLLHETLQQFDVAPCNRELK